MVFTDAVKGVKRHWNNKGNFRHISLRTRIYLLILSFTVFALLILLVTISYFSDRALIKMTTISSKQNLSLISQKMDMLTQNVESTAIFVLTHDDVQKWLVAWKKNPSEKLKLQDEVSGYFNNVLKYDFISNLMIYPYNNSNDKYTIFNYSNPNENEIIKNFYDIPNFEIWTMNTDVRFNYVLNSAHSPYSITYYKKVYNKFTVDPIGLIGIMVNEASISALYKNIKLGETGYYFIIDHAGNIVSSVQKDRLGMNISDMPDYPEIAASLDGTTKVSKNSNRLVIYSDYKKLGWKIIGIVPMSEVTQENRSLRFFTFLVGVLLIMVVTYLSNLLSKYISKPIIWLKEIVIGVGAGKRSIETPVDRYDEIGELYTAFFTMLHKLDDLTNKIIEDNNKQKGYEFALLQAQVNPHFLYNTLECICGLSMLGKNEDVVHATTELACFYRSVFSKNTIVSVKTALDIIRLYYNIIQYRYPNKLSYTIRCDPNIENCGIIKLCIQPIVENAIVHGLFNCKRNWFIEVEAKKVDDKIVISVKDNGIGMTQQKIEEIFKGDPDNSKSMNFGIRATDERIKLSFGNQYGLTVQSEYRKWTKVVITFPNKAIDQYHL